MQIVQFHHWGRRDFKRSSLKSADVSQTERIWERRSSSGYRKAARRHDPKCAITGADNFRFAPEIAVTPQMHLARGCFRIDGSAKRYDEVHRGHFIAREVFGPNSVAVIVEPFDPSRSAAISRAVRSVLIPLADGANVCVIKKINGSA
jgi:hypothetical protein